MLKSKFFILALLLATGLSSCGLFHKSCNCPHFGAIKAPAATTTSQKS